VLTALLPHSSSLSARSAKTSHGRPWPCFVRVAAACPRCCLCVKSGAKPVA
jgi:hypothetical protein